MYQLIHKKRVQESFPNVEIALRMYLVLMISNCSAERSKFPSQLLKDDNDQEQTSDIGMQWSFVSHGAPEHRIGHSAWDQLRGPGNRVCQGTVTKSFTTLKFLHVQYKLSMLRLLVIVVGHGQCSNKSNQGEFIEHLLQSAVLVFHMLCRTYACVQDCNK